MRCDMKILIVEDDRELAELLKKGLAGSGYDVDISLDGEEGFYYLCQNIYDAAVIDRMLPSMSGTELIKKARKEGIATPVIMATALGEIEDRIEGLDTGADDYIVKPFDIRELEARIRALTRRPVGIGETEEMSLGDITFIPASLIIRGTLGECPVSKTEADLLESFIKNPEKTLSREYLFARVWGNDSDVDDTSLDTYIHFIRRHLKSVSRTVSVATLRRVGYRLEVKDDN